MEAFNNFVCPGVANYSESAAAPVYVEIDYDGTRLSVTGVHGPLRNGDAKGGCGQINLLELQPYDFDEGWNQEKLNMLAAIWKEYHLNNMVAGSPAQAFYLRHNPVNDRLNFFTQASTALTEAGLNPDPNHIINGKPYLYGSAWLQYPVPEWALNWLYNLPETNRTVPRAWDSR